MPMHTVIQQRRRALGLTQEQVAEHLTVTAPAVSKWEKGITTPDIALLPSLARLLKIDLNTLFSFQEHLDPQEIGAFCAGLSKMPSCEAAFAAAEDKCREFPHSEELLLTAALVLESMLLCSNIPSEETVPFEEKIALWYDQLSESSDDKISSSAKYMSVNRCIRQGKLDMAQRVLDTIQDKNALTSALPDKLTLQTSIYLKQGKADLAALELEKALYAALNRVQLLLSQLASAEDSAGKAETVENIAQCSFRMTELFGLWRYPGYAALFQTASKDTEKALSLLEKMLDALITPWDPSASPLFHRIAPERKEGRTPELLSILLKALETDPACAHLRESPGYAELLAKYKVHLNIPQ